MDIALDPLTGDLLIEGGDLVLLTGRDAILQHLTIRLRFFLGEWEWDTRIGIPFFERILVKNPDLNAVRTLLRDAITSTPGVTGIQRFDLELEAGARTLRLDFEASTDEGPVTFDRELILV